MAEFPRSWNGFIDDGSQIASTSGQKCPNCGSTNYRQTLSTEKCSSCGYEFGYWSGGGNAVHDKLVERQLFEEHARQIALDAEIQATCGPPQTYVRDYGDTD